MKNQVKALLKSLFLLLFMGSTTLMAQNAGFENISGRTDWNSFSVADWTRGGTYVDMGAATTYGSNYVYTGSNAIGITVNSSSNWATLTSTGYAVTTPSGSGYYMHVIVYATDDKNGKTELALGLNTNNTTTWSSTTSAISSSGYTAHSYTVAVSGNTTYYPAIRVKKTNGNDKITVGLDNVIIYYDQNSGAADLSSPGKPASPSVSIGSGKVNITFTEGSDNTNGSGIGGYLVLRYSGAGSTLPAVSNQTTYSTTNTAVGPTILTVASPYEQWNVIYTGNTNNGVFSENLQSGVFTYLIYMRDKANNYSAPVRVVVSNGYGSSNNPITIDALGLISGTLSNQSYMTFTPGASITNGNGILRNNKNSPIAVIEVPSGVNLTVTKIDAGDGIVRVLNGGSLTVGEFNNTNSVQKIEVENGGVLTIGKLYNGDGVVQVKSGGTLNVTQEVKNWNQVAVFQVDNGRNIQSCQRCTDDPPSRKNDRQRQC